MFKIAVLVILFMGAFAIAFLLLWNWLVPELFNGPRINFWQALGLLALSKLVLGFGGSSKEHFKSKFKEKYTGLSDAEKEEMRQKFKDRWCKPSEETEN